MQMKDGIGPEMKLNEKEWKSRDERTYLPNSIIDRWWAFSHWFICISYFFLKSLSRCLDSLKTICWQIPRVRTSRNGMDWINGGLISYNDELPWPLSFASAPSLPRLKFWWLKTTQFENNNAAIFTGSNSICWVLTCFCHVWPYWQDC